MYVTICETFWKPAPYCDHRRYGRHAVGPDSARSDAGS